MRAPSKDHAPAFDSPALLDDPMRIDAHALRLRRTRPSSLPLLAFAVGLLASPFHTGTGAELAAQESAPDGP
ncbi:MAG: hypothetical protein AAF570_27875, partial [Bacteroidota bacterium]